MKFPLALVLGLALYCPTVLSCDDHAPGSEPRAVASGRLSSLASGQIRELDLDGGTVTLRHGAIAGLGMKPMESMLFQALERKVLAGFKVGDRVEFRVRKIGEQPVIVSMAAPKRRGP